MEDLAVGVSECLLPNRSDIRGDILPSIDETCRTCQTCPTDFGNVWLRAIVEFNQMFSLTLLTGPKILTLNRSWGQYTQARFGAESPEAVLHYKQSHVASHNNGEDR